MPVVLVRHAERVDYVTPGWTQTADRPWDTPLTDNGLDQARQAGKSIGKFCEKFSLPPVARVMTSPLTRCVETAVNIASVLGVSSLDAEAALAETVCEKWYKSWAFKGISDSKWGGPKEFDWGTVEEASVAGLLHPAATKPVFELYPNPKEVEAINQNANRRSQAMVKMNAAYTPMVGKEQCSAFTWGSFETDEQLGERMAALAAKVDVPDKTTVLVSHGGPCGRAYRHLTGNPVGGSVGYTSIFLLVQGPEGKWQTLVKANMDHLAADVDAGLAATE